MGANPKSAAAPVVLTSAEAAISFGIEGSAALFSNAASLGYRARVVLSLQNKATQASEERKPHGVKSAVRTLVLACQAISDGYRFDDDRSESKIKAMSKAAKTLEDMSDYILSFYDRS